METSTGRVPCPSCAEQIMKEATVCPFCKTAIFSKDKGANAVIGLVVSALLFVVIYFAISAFVDHETDRTMGQITRDAQKLMRDLQYR